MSPKAARRGDRRLYARHRRPWLHAAGGDMPKAALGAKLVEQVADRRTFEERLAVLGGKDEDAEGRIPADKAEFFIADAVDTNPEGPIGIVTIAGEIVDGKAPAGTAAGDSIAGAIEKGLRGDRLKALVVRIDSPGGSVMASERIRQALACGQGEEIAGSGVDGQRRRIGRILGRDAGRFHFRRAVDGDRVDRGVRHIAELPGNPDQAWLGRRRNQDDPSVGRARPAQGPLARSRPADPDRGRQASIGKFLGLVAQSRRKSPADIDRIAQGRVWDGGTARQLGLVDGFGGMPEAIAKAAELAKLGDERGVTYLERPESLRDSILEMLAGEDEGSTPPDAFGTLKAAPEMAILAAIGEVRAILSGPSIQVRCLECPPVARSRMVAADTGLFARLIGWLAG